MPWSGSGQFNRSNGVHSGSTVWAQDAAEPVNILSTRHDTHDEDFASGLENTVTLDGQTTPTANLPMGGFKHTNVAVASARTDYARTSQVADGAFTYSAAGGTANAITATLSPAVTAYATGMQVRVIPGLNNTAAATLNVNGVGATAIKKISGQSAVVALQQGDILTGKPALFTYDGTQWILENPSAVPSYNAAHTAAGSVQGDATLIDATMSNVSGADGTKGVILNTYAQGTITYINNVSISALKVYPPVGWSFAAKTANTAISLPANAGGIFFVTAATGYGACIGATF